MPLETRSTARQRQYARALGISFDVKATRQQLSKRIDQAHRKLDKRANRAQRKLLKKHGLIKHRPNTRREASDILMEFFKAQAWVYSVCRHQIQTEGGGRWSKYTECPLPAKEIRRMVDRVIESENAPISMDGAKRCGGAQYLNYLRGNVWYGMPKRVRSSEGYNYVANLLEERLPRALKKARKKASKKKARDSRKRSACGIMILLVLILVALLVAAKSCSSTL